MRGFAPFAPFTGAVRGGGGPSPLLTDLVEWWEDAETTGKHAATALGFTPGTLATGPAGTGLDAWELDTAGTAGGLSVDVEDSTVAMLVKIPIGASNVVRMFLNLVGSWDSLGARNLTTENWEAMIRGTRTNTGVTYSGDYDSIVVTPNNMYINGTATNPAVGSDTGTRAIKLFADSRGSSAPESDMFCATIAVVNRIWTQTDVDAFHNSGDFLKFDDL